MKLPVGRLEATLEAERGDRRRLERDHQRQREAETMAYEQAIKVRNIKAVVKVWFVVHRARPLTRDVQYGSRLNFVFGTTAVERRTWYTKCIFRGTSTIELSVSEPNVRIFRGSMSLYFL